MTIITHGFQAFNVSHTTGWLEAMAESIVDRSGSDAAVYEMVISNIHLNPFDQSVFVSSFNYIKGTIPVQGDKAEIVVKVYWDSIANQENATSLGVSTPEIASAILPFLVGSNAAPGLQQPLAELPIHLIGHSRGASLVSELARLLGQQGSWVDQLTTLDPHPVRPFDVPPANDALVKVYENTLFADNYYEDETLTVPDGSSVPGAYNRHLTHLLGGYGDPPGTADHSDVHLWYHGTLNTIFHASDGDAAFTDDMRAFWYEISETIGKNAGFYYSRLGGGDRTGTNDPASLGVPIVSGYHYRVGGGSLNRLLFNAGERAPNGSQWPNIITLKHTGSNSVTASTSVPVSFQYQTYAGQSTVTLYWDTDQNPYNNQSAIPCGSPLTPAQTGAQILSQSYQASTQGLPSGTYYICAKIQANGLTRYAYDPQKLSIQNPVVVPGAPAAPTNLTANVISSSQISLSWKDNSNIETGFIVQRKTGPNGTFTSIPTSPFPLPANTMAYFDSGLSQGTGYFYQIIASGSTNSDSSNVAQATTQSNTGFTRVLTINSANPSSGVYVYLSPNDVNGLADGKTSFSRQYTTTVMATVYAYASWGGNTFQKWQKDGQDVTTSLFADVIMDASHTMTAVYTTPVVTGYSISTSSFPSNGGTTSGGGTFTNGATVTITAAPASGYQFLNWTLNTSAQNGGTVFSPNATWQFAANSNLSLLANFVQNSAGATITTTASPANGGTTNGGGVYQSGQLAPVSATPASGWEFGTWTDEFGDLVSFASSFSYPVYQSHNYVAHFNPILSQNYTLAITASNGTAIRSPNQVAYTPGSSVTITATPISGYLFTGWSGSASGTQNPLTVTMTGNLAVTANFSAVPASSYTVTLPARTGGTVSKSPDLPFYSQGSVVTLTASPNSGYVFGSWRRDTYGNSNPLQITMDGNKTAVADFIPSSPGSAVLVIGTPTNISVSATAGTNNLVVYNQGSGTMYWTASPTVSWLQVNGSGSTGVTGGGGSNGLPISWVDNPTTSSRTGEIRVYSPGAQQSPQIFTVTQAAGVPHFTLNVTADNGTVTKSPDQASYTTGTSVTLTAAAITGYQFTGWTGDVTSNQPTVAITMDGNKNVTANFQIVPNPDLFPTVSVQQGIAYAGTPYALTGTIGNRGVGLSNSFKAYCLFSSSNLVAPSADMLSATAPVNFSGVNGGASSALTASVTVPANFSPGSYYLWVVVDPELNSGEATINRGNNNIVVPFTVFPSPAASGPDLVTGDFSASPSGAFPGANIEVKFESATTGRFHHRPASITFRSPLPQRSHLTRMHSTRWGYSRCWVSE